MRRRVDLPEPGLPDKVIFIKTLFDILKLFPDFFQLTFNFNRGLTNRGMIAFGSHRVDLTI